MLHHSAKKNTKKDSEGEEKKSEISLEPEPKMQKIHVSQSIKFVDNFFSKKNSYSSRGKKGWIFRKKSIENTNRKLLYQS